MDKPEDSNPPEPRPLEVWVAARGEVPAAGLVRRGPAHEVHLEAGFKGDWLLWLERAMDAAKRRGARAIWASGRREDAEALGAALLGHRDAAALPFVPGRATRFVPKGGHWRLTHHNVGSPDTIDERPEGLGKPL